MNNPLQNMVKKSIEFLQNNPIPSNSDYYLETLKKISTSLQENTLSFAVIGVTSSGKSAFINALLGEKILPERSIPTSGVLAKCQKGKEKKLIIRFKNGQSKEYEGEAVTPDLVSSFAEEEQNKENKKGVYDLLLFSPKMQIPENFILVDTPGLNAYGCPGHEELTIQELLPIANIVVLLTSIRDPFKRASFDILLEALERNIEKNQRIFFVQTCKDIARKSTEKGKTIESKEENLKKHRERLFKSITDNTILQDSCIIQVSSLKAQEYYSAAQSNRCEQLLHESGFEEVSKVLQSYSPQMDKLILASNAQNISIILKEILFILEKSCNYCQDDIKDTTEDRKKNQSEIADLKKRINNIKQEIANYSRSIKSNSSKKKSSIIDWFKDGFKTDSNSKLRELGKETNKRLENIWRNLFKDLDEKKKGFKEELDNLGIPRLDIPINKPKELMRPFPKLGQQKIQIRKPKRGLWQGIKRFFGRESGWEKIAKYLTKKKEFGREIIDYIEYDFELVYIQINQWRENLKKTQIAPLEETLEKKLTIHKEILEKYKRGELNQERLENQFIFWKNIDKKIKLFIRANPIKISISKPRNHEKLNPQKTDNISDSLHRKIWNAVSSVREIQIARTFLKTVAGIAGPHPKVLFLGPKEIGKTQYLKSLFHNVKNGNDMFPSPTKEIALYFLGDAEKPFPKTIRYNEYKLHEKLLNYVSIIDTPGDENLSQNLDYATLFQNVDIIALFFRLQTLGSSVNDYLKSPYSAQMKSFRKKIVYIGVGGREFLTRLEQLYFECYIYFCKNSGLGEHPMIIFEDYDNRYNLIFDMLKKPITEINDWENYFTANGGFFDDTITRNILVSTYHKMMEEVLDDK